MFCLVILFVFNSCNFYLVKSFIISDFALNKLYILKNFSFVTLAKRIDVEFMGNHLHSIEDNKAITKDIGES